MTHPWTLADLDVVPRVGFVQDASPVTALPALADEIGAAWLGAKRDDRIPALHGGTKVRKLDVLLAAPPWRDAPVWSSVGAIGSGHLVALTAAARRLDRAVEADVFFEPPNPAVLANLAFVASGPSALRFHAGRAGLVLALAPRWLRGRPVGWIPPGGTNADGMLGVVRAGLELAGQVARGELPAPDDVFVAAGTGGTAAGLAVGLGLGGLRPTVHAVVVVERPMLGRRKLERLIRAVRARLEGLRPGPLPDPAPIRVVRGFVGPGYGRASEASVAACGRLDAHGVPLEAIYGGKAMAALLDQAPRGRNVLFWVTSHGGDLPASDRWRDRLPASLTRRLAGPSRRGLLLGALALGATLILARRITGYERLPAWDGAVLAAWEAEVVAAVAESLLPDVPGGLVGGPTAEDVARNVDRYLRGMPSRALAEVHGLLALLEHGTLLGGRLRRITRLPFDARRGVLEAMASGPLRDAYRGIRDLCLLGYWQDDRTWGVLGYGGPLVAHPGVPRRADGLPGGPSTYDALVAPPGTTPRGTL